jgi:ribosome-binding protein aMBF1 (putative translation factor)
MSQFNDTVVLRNPKAVKENKKKNTTKSVVSPSNSNKYQQKKVNEDEENIKKIETVGHTIGQKIMQARAAKGWKQKDVSNKMSMQPNDYQKIENGTAPRNGQQLNKLGRILGVKLTGKGV